MTNRDFRDLLAAFSARDVRFLVVGGYAVTFHARPRFTKDLDVWIDPTPDNARRVYEALAAFGSPLAAHGVRVEDENPRGPSSGQRRVLRGGAYDTTPTITRIARRLSNRPDIRHDEKGFRCVQDPR